MADHDTDTPPEVTPLETITSTDLFALDLTPPKMIVPGLVASGFNIIGGAPKSGKSWLALQLAHAVAVGGYLLGTKVTQGRALYLALEDTRYRLKHRMEGVRLDPTPMLEFATESPTLGRGGFAAVDRFITERADVSLVVIDTLARVKDLAVGGGNAYENDSQLGAALQTLAFNRDIALVVVHHMSKGGNRDFLLSLSGSAGLPGAADVVMALQRDRNDQHGKLHITGRDIEERAIDIDWTPRGWQTPAPLVPDYDRWHN